ncbi:MAG: hypothetical protein IPK13_22070 [Deltaproteobacteria bacterium]|nr:hypothetical protein [Deltaproteobacteria bacterium]
MVREGWLPRSTSIAKRFATMGVVLFGLVSLVTIGTVGTFRVASAGPWEDLMGQGEPKIWTDPKGRFDLDLPDGWHPKTDPDQPQLVVFWRRHPDRGYVAKVSVEIRSLPPRVHVNHFDARVEEEMKAQSPGYALIEADTPTISGVKARRRFFTYRERNNAELKNEVVQATFIIGQRGFVLTLETALGARGVFWEDFLRMEAGFSGRAPGDESMIRKNPRRIKSGEMVNPDAIKY